MAEPLFPESSFHLPCSHDGKVHRTLSGKSKMTCKEETGTQHCAETACRDSLTGLLAGEEAFPDLWWVSGGGNFPQSSSFNQAAQDCSQSSHCCRHERDAGLFLKDFGGRYR